MSRSVRPAYRSRVSRHQFTQPQSLAARPTEGVFQLGRLYELDADPYYGAFAPQFPGKTSKGEAAFSLCTITTDGTS